MKRKLISLLLSAVMLFTLVTPAFADEEQLPDEAAVEEETVAEEVGEETVGEEVGEETVTEDEEVVGETVEDEEVTLFEDEEGGGGEAYPVEGDVATVNNCDQFYAALDDERVTKIVVESEVKFDFPEDNQENFEITKPLIIDGTLRIENTYVTAVANVTVNGRLEIYGDFDHYTEWHMDAPNDYWGAFTEMPDELDGPKLINNGEIRMDGLSGIMLSYPCDYEGNGELSGGEFKYADYLNYDGADESNPGLTACYTEEQTKIETVFYDDNGREYSRTVLRTAYVNTEMGLKTALNRDVYNSSIQVFGKDEDDDYEITLSKEEAESGVYDAPCTLMTNVPFTVGEGVTLNLADGTFNQFNNGLTVGGTLNVNTNGNMCFVNGGLTVEEGGTLNNAPGSNLNINGGYTNIAGTLTNNGNLGFYGEEGEGCVDINGELINNGRMENCMDLIIKQGGKLTVNDSDEEIAYERDREEVNDHALFNRASLKVEKGGTLTVGGYLQNDGCVEVCGEMQVCATAQDNNKAPDTDDHGVLNGAVQSFGDLDVNGGTLTVMGAEDEKPFGGALVSHGKLSIHEDGRVIADGQLWTVGEVWIWDNEADQEAPNLKIGGVFYNYSNMNLDGGLMSIEGEAYNEDGSIDLNGGELRVSGYLRNNSRMYLNGGTLKITPAVEQNFGDNPAQFNEKCSVLCNNNELFINGGAELVVAAADTEAPFNALLRNNGYLNNNGKLELFGTLVNYGGVENRNEFTVSGENARIKNHNRLMVGDSATYGGGDYGDLRAIKWEDGANDKANLFDEEAYRVWLVYGPEYRKLEENFSSIKGCELYGNTVMLGRDYYGGWEDVADCTVETENENIVGINTDGERYGTFRLFYNEWGDTRLNVKVGDEVVRSYDISCCLDFAGFYTGRALVDDGRYLDEAEAQGHYAVLGRRWSYNIGDQLWLMRRDDGFNDEVWDFNEDNCWINLWCSDEHSGRAEIRPDDFGWYHVSIFGTEYFKFRPEQRPNSERYDLLFEFTGGECSYEIDGDLCGTRFNLNCLKPTVYIEDAAAVKGGDVTVAVCADNFSELLGYQLQLAFDPNKLTAKGVAVNGEYYCDYEINDGTVRVSVPTTENNRIENGDLFYVTFTVADTDAVGACDNIAVKFDKHYPQKTATKDGNSEKYVSTAYHDGFVQTFIPGDVHRDGEVDILDAVRLLRAAAELVELSPAERESARVAENGNDDLINGVVPILQYIVRDTPLTYYPPVQSAQD